MARTIQTVVKLVVAAFLGLGLEGFLLRDPWVELGNGYNIGAIAWSFPCHLTYFESQDPRPPATWLALRDDNSFAIRNREKHDYREYATEQEWKEAVRELNARPSSGQTLLDNVTAFDCDSRFAIGWGDDGGFLLDMGEDDVEVLKAREEWAKAVRSRTTLDPDRLRDPKAWHLQYRHSVYWAIMGPYMAVAGVWIVVPLVRRRSGTGRQSCGTIAREEGAPP